MVTPGGYDAVDLGSNPGEKKSLLYEGVARRSFGHAALRRKAARAREAFASTNQIDTTAPV